MIWAQYPNIALYFMDGRTLLREGGDPRSAATGGFGKNFKCKDGRWLKVGLRDWHESCRMLGVESLEKDPMFEDPKKRQANSQELTEILEKTLASKTREEWVERFRTQTEGLTYELVNRIIDLPDDPQVVANNYIVDYDHPGLGPIKMLKFPFNMSKTPGVPNRRPAQNLVSIIRRSCRSSAIVWKR